MAVSKRLRYEVLRRDNHACKYCGRTAPEVVLTVDHVIPVSLGGSDDPKNLVAACRDCNAGKTSSNPDAPLVETVGDDALRWAQAMRQAADEIAAHDEQIEDILDDVQDAWKPYYLPADWAASVVTFIKSGLSREDLLAMVRVAYAKRGIGSSGRWAYFCGCCWSRIRQYQDRAAEIIGSESGAGTPQILSLTTDWTKADIEAIVQRAEQTASSWLEQDSIDSAYCTHREWAKGSCDDPVCRAMRAESLGWMSYSNMLAADRRNAIADAAEVLLDD